MYMICLRTNFHMSSLLVH